MEVSRELLFFFSALGAFNGIGIGLYFLLFAKPKVASNYFLGVLVLALSIRTGKSVFLHFSSHLAGPFIQFGLSACLFIGPALHFYLRSVTHPDQSQASWKYHFIPLFIAIVYVAASYPWYDYPTVWHYIIRTIYKIWLTYILLGAWTIRKLLLKIPKREKLSTMEVWIISIFLGNLIVWIAYNTISYTSYIVGALSFTFILYLLVILLVFTRKKDPSFMNRHVKYGNKKIDATEAKELQERIHQLMDDEKLYKNANLKLPDLAAKLHILPHRLSQLMNDNMGKNFTAFVNEYRIKHAQKLISSDTHLKLESIGYECGFNSKSTFYAAFKKVTGVTPSAFKAKFDE